MSRSTTVIVGERGFWASDDAFAVWLAYVVEEIERQGAVEPWLASLARDWRVAAVVTDFGADAGELTPEQCGRLHTIALAARQRAVEAGDIPVERLRQWIMVDDYAVSDGFSRTGDQIELARVLEVADGFIALLDGSLPPEPPTGTWFLGTGDGWRLMERRPEAWTQPRFPRRR